MNTRFGIGFVGFIIIIALLAVGSFTIPLWRVETVKFEVSDKERIVDNGGETSRYVIFTENETFENTDHLLLRKFDSSDLHGKLEAGKTYECTAHGFRIPFLSMYRNINDCVEV